MKILHFIPDLTSGGAEKFTIDLCNEFSENNEVIICTLYDITEDMFMVNSLYKNIKLVSLNKKLGFDFSIFWKIYSLIRKEKPDIVNTHLRALFYTCISIGLSKIKFFHTVHNMAENETDNVNRILYKFLFKYLNITPIAISKKVSESVKNIYGNEFNVLIENGVSFPSITKKIENVKEEIDGYKIDINTKVFLTIGRISEQKNHIMLIDVFNNLIKHGENIILLIIGDDYSDEKKLKSLLEKRARNNIYFLGLKNNISDYFACSDAFCLSSLYEGLPITLLESLAMGVIPICTPAGGVVDVIDEKNGFVSKSFTPKDYEAEILKFLELHSKDKYNIIENNKTLFHAKYGIELTAKKYVELYEKKLNDL